MRWHFGWIVTFIAIACSPGMTPEQRTELAAHAVTLEHCQDVGRASNSYAVYQACKEDAGIK